jgi:hypothetical protein
MWYMLQQLDEALTQCLLKSNFLHVLSQAVAATCPVQLCATTALLTFEVWVETGCALVQTSIVSQEARTKAHAEFVQQAAQQHSFAPDSAEYLQQLAHVEGSLASSKEQCLLSVQAAASKAAAGAAARLEKTICASTVG